MMSILFTYPSDLLIGAVGWALIHSLWQGTFIAVLLAVVLRAFPGPGASSRTRYAMSCAALVVVVSMFVLTCVHYVGVDQTYQGQSMETGNPASIVDLTPIGDTPPRSIEPLAAVDQTAGPFGLVEHYLPLMVLAWLSGLAIVSLRLLTGWGMLRRMCNRGVSPISPALQARVSSLRQAMNVKPIVRVLESSRAMTPMVIGWVRPVILLPSASLTGLSSQQLQAVIAHELAHVMRYDYLINLLQCLVETLLFYHPAVWWIGRVIRQERERCCDDLAVKVCGDRVAYARALLLLAESAAPFHGKLAPAASGGDLSSRVCRLMGVQAPSQIGRGTAGLWSTLASLCLVAVFVVAVQADNEGELKDEQVVAVATEATAALKNPDAEAETKQRIIEIPYQKLIDGDTAYNIVIRPGDVIRVQTQRAYVYIGGSVNRPGAYNIPGQNDLTLKQLIVSSGTSLADNPPLYAKLVRRVPPDQEEVMYFSLDDIFDGWTQDAFVAPNDVIVVTLEPGPEDEPAKERRLLRERVPSLKHELVRLQEQLAKAVHEFGDGHRLVQSIVGKTKAAEAELKKIKKNLRRDEKSVVLKIIPAQILPTDEQATPPSQEDLTPRPWTNTAQAGDQITIRVSHADEQRSETMIIKRLDDKLRLSLPGIKTFNFHKVAIQQAEDILRKEMQASNAYSDVDSVEIVLPGKTYLMVSQDSNKLSSHSLPRVDYRLLEAIAQAGGVPDGTSVIRVIRHPSSEESRR